MTALLSMINIGTYKGSLATDEEKTVNSISKELTALKEIFLASFAGKQVNLQELFDQQKKDIKSSLEPFGPFLEAPSLNYTENIGPSTIFTEIENQNKSDIDGIFRKSLETLGGSAPSNVAMESVWRKEQDAEALQAFNSEQNQKEKREKILSNITPLISHTRFKSVDFPDKDYTQYLRARSLVQAQIADFWRRFEKP